MNWRNGTFPSTQSSYTSLISMCALAAHRTTKGYLFNNELFTSTDNIPRSFFATEDLAEANTLLPSTLAQSRESVDHIRCHSLLALLAAQSGDTPLHQHLALCHSLAALTHFHDEARWPTSLSTCDKEVRRRIY